MSCCPEPLTVPLSDRHRVRVRYLGGRPVVVRGPTSGNYYRFSGLERVQSVDPRDAAALVRSPLFRAEGIIEVPAS